jgi:HemY protein
VWTADGFVADRWMPVSPVSGALDAFQWRVPVEAVEKSEGDVLASKLEELVALGMSRADAEPDEESEVEPVTAAPTIGTKEEPATREVPHRAEPELPEAKVRNEATAKQSSVPDTTTEATRRGAKTASPATRTRTRPTEAVPSQNQRDKAEPREARAYVPPHAPDDPGTEQTEPEEVTLPLRPQRA